MTQNADVVWMACESHLRRFGHVANCAPCLAVTLDYVRAEVRELRRDRASRDRVGVMGERMDFISRLELDALIAEVRELRRDQARLEDLAGRRAVVLAFFRSVIHCREPWTDKCQLEYDAAMGDGVS